MIFHSECTRTIRELVLVKGSYISRLPYTVDGNKSHTLLRKITKCNEVSHKVQVHKITHKWILFQYPIVPYCTACIFHDQKMIDCFFLNRFKHFNKNSATTLISRIWVAVKEKNNLLFKALRSKERGRAGEKIQCKTAFRSSVNRTRKPVQRRFC